MFLLHINFIMILACLIISDISYIVNQLDVKNAFLHDNFNEKRIFHASTHEFQ